MLISVRGGGHSISGKAVCEGGLMIDLSSMNSVRVDQGAKTVRADGGCLKGHIDRELAVFGLGTTGGIVSHTGAAGLTLGGPIPIAISGVDLETCRKAGDWKESRNSNKSSTTPSVLKFARRHRETGVAFFIVGCQQPSLLIGTAERNSRRGPCRRPCVCHLQPRNVLAPASSHIVLR